MELPTNLSFRNRDPWASLISGTLGWAPRRYAIAILVTNLVVNIVLAASLGAFVTRAGSPGLLQDPTSILVDFLLMPAVGAFYIWSISVIPALLKQLYAQNFLRDNDRVNAIVKDLSRKLYASWALGASAGVAAIAMLLFIGSYLDWYPWPQLVSFFSHSRTLTWLKAPMWFLTIYGLSFGLFNVGLTILGLRNIFREQSLNISPWHPDRCGGLKSVSTYSMTLGYAIAVVGLTLSVQTIQEIQRGTFGSSYLTWFGLGAYLILAPLVFFLPLGTAHAAMNKAKNTQLLQLSQHFDVQYQRISEALNRDDVDYSGNVNRIETLQKLYMITEQFTIWPFDTVNLRRFLTITLAPLLPALGSIAFELIG
ncbi:MAG: hypothetical protein ACE5M4_02390 [Anaerolineales bacterium]